MADIDNTPHALHAWGFPQEWPLVPEQLCQLMQEQQVEKETVSGIMEATGKGYLCVWDEVQKGAQ